MNFSNANSKAIEATNKWLLGATQTPRLAAPVEVVDEEEVARWSVRFPTVLT